MKKSVFTRLVWATLALAVVFLVSPWVFGFTQGAMVNSVVGAVLAGGASLLALNANGRLKGWRAIVLLNMVLGGYMFIAPMLFHYNANDPATWLHMVGGLALTVLATMQMWRVTGALAAI